MNPGTRREVTMPPAPRRGSEVTSWDDERISAWRRMYEQEQNRSTMLWSQCRNAERRLNRLEGWLYGVSCTLVMVSAFWLATWLST